jgi:hypothetical protein
MSSAAAPEITPADSSGVASRFSERKIVLALAALKLVFQLATASRYGYFGDELYYYGCSEHPQWGYIDHPPLVAGLMWVGSHLFGTSVLGIRVIPSILAAVLVWLAAAMAREFGGGRFAQIAAACAVLATPVYMSVYHYFSMNAVEPVLWSACVLTAARALTRNPKYWLLFGVLAGLGLENKYSIALFIAALVAGLIVSPFRRSLLTVHFWAGVLLAVLIFLPNLLWLVHHNYPFLQWQSTMEQRGEVHRVALGMFVEHQLLLTGAACVVWIAGLAYLLLGRSVERYRFIGFAHAFSFVCLIVLKGKTSYAQPLYAPLIGAGAIWLEHALTTRWARRATIAMLLVTGAIFAPCYVPVLPINQVVAYQSKIPLPLPVQFAAYAQHEKLPQNFSLESGWDDIVAGVAQAYQQLPPERRAKAGILTFHYATAGAVDMIGPKYGLPKAISTAMSWHDWGPREYHGDTLILVGQMFPPQFCEHYEDAPPVRNPYVYDGVGFTGNIIHVCYGLKFDLQKQWDGLPWY